MNRQVYAYDAGTVSEVSSRSGLSEIEARKHLKRFGRYMCGCNFGDITAVKKGVFYTVDRLSARSVFPMHAGGGEVRYREFAKEAKTAGYDVPFCLAEFSGDHFMVTPTAVSGAFDKEAVCQQTEKNDCGR